MIDFDYRTPSELSAAAAILTEYGDDAKVLAGGTTLLLLMKRRLVSPRVLVSLHRVPGLATVGENDGGLRIGAAATLRDLETSPLLTERFPGLGQALAQVATIRIRNQATIGGNLALGDPLMDLPAVLTTLDGSVELSSSSGSRTIPLAGFFTDYLTTTARPDEIITQIHVPFLPPTSTAVYLKYLPRTVADYGTIGVAIWLSLDAAGERVHDVRIALAGAGPTTLRALEAETALRGRRANEAAFAVAAAAVRSSTSPTSDSRGSAHYKRHMTEVFVRRALRQALGNVRNGPLCGPTRS
ncbi:MAG: FAD binding domain-containing protein [Pseudonocardiaceae bacterium]